MKFGTCVDDGCTLDIATGIYSNDTCTTAAPAGYYSDGLDRWHWNGPSTLTYDGGC